MKKIVKILGCVAVMGLVVFVAGCSGSKTAEDDGFMNAIDGDGGIVERYITWYIRPTELRFYTEVYTGVNYIDIVGEILSTEQNYELSVKYNDLSYNQIQSVPMTALYDGITSLSMETVDYFDEGHPAGSDISDMVYCKYLTYYDFITSGYVPIDKDYHLYPPLFYIDEKGSKLYEMMLPEVNYDNSQLMTDQMIIEFPVEPETPGIYSFIFRFNMPEIQLETTFEYEFSGKVVEEAYTLGSGNVLTRAFDTNNSPSFSTNEGVKSTSEGKDYYYQYNLNEITGIRK